MSKWFAVLARPRVQGITDLIISTHGSRRILALCTATAMLNLCLTVAFASPKSDFKVPTGIANVGGEVLIDGLFANSGQTLFSGSRIVTAEGSESTLNLGNRTRLKLYAESRLTVEFSSSTLLGSLEQGTLHGFVPAGIRANIVASEASVVSDPAQPAAFSIQVEAGDTTISVETGGLEVRTGDTLRSVAAGESFRLVTAGHCGPHPSRILIIVNGSGCFSELGLLLRSLPLPLPAEITNRHARVA